MQYTTKVILCGPKEEEPKSWQYWDWGTAHNQPVGGWYDGLSPEAKDKLDTLLKINAKTEIPIHWLGFKYMQGALKAQKIWQLSFHDAAGQVRVLGIFGKRKQAILLIGCTHKGSVYTPPNALETAISRAKDFRNGMVKLYERPIRTDL